MIFNWDAGFAYCKAISDKGQQVIFPSVVGEIPPTQADMFSNGDFQISLDGNSWLLGDSALRQSLLLDDQQSRDWVLSPQWRAMLLAGISQVTKASKVDVEVVTGLPFGDYKQYKDRLKDTLLGQHRIKREGRNTQAFNIVGVKILTQNFAPLFTHLPSLNIDAQVGVLNIGSKTVELATVQLNKGGRPEAIRTQCQTVSSGTRTILPLIRSMLTIDNPGIKYTDYEIDKLLPKMDTTHYTQMLKTLISRNWADNMVYPLNKLSHFIVTGGGASLVGIELRKWLERDKVGPEVMLGDNFDIVKGYSIARKVMG